MGRLDDLMLNVSPVLTGVALGYKVEGLIGDKVLPVLPVTGLTVRLPKYGADLLQVDDDSRALRTLPKTVTWTPSYVDVTLREHAITVPVDWLEKKAGDEVQLDVMARAAKTAKRRVVLGREKAVADLLKNTATYASGHSETVGAGFGWNEKTSGTSNVDVVDVILSKAELIRQKIGVAPNIFWCGAQTWNAIQRNTYVLNRMAFAPAAIQASRVTEEAFAAAIGVDKVYVGKAVYSSDGSMVSDLWGDAAGLIYAEPNPSEVEAPTFGMLALEKFAFDAEDEAYGLVRTWEEGGGIVTNVSYHELYAPWVALNTAGYLWLDTVK